MLQWEGLCSVLNCYVSSQFTEEKFRQFIACCNVTIIAKSCSYPEQIVAKYFIVLLNSPFESRVSFRGKKIYQLLCIKRIIKDLVPEAI